MQRDYLSVGFGSVEGAAPLVLVLAEPAGGVVDCGWGAELAEQQLMGDVEPPAGLKPDDAMEQQLGTTGFGADTPAMSEPSPSFCSVGASSFPLASIPLAD